jgi:uridine kinase
MRLAFVSESFLQSHSFARIHNNREPFVNTFSFNRVRSRAPTEQLRKNFLFRECVSLPVLTMSLTIVGVTGCSGSGKSTICAKLSEYVDCKVINGDEFLIPQEQCPPLDLTQLPWLAEEVPAAFAPKRHDTNCPECVDWPAFESAVRQAIDEETQMIDGQSRILFIESFLLLHSPFIVSILNILVRINIRDENWPDIIRRKWERRHLGKPSYKERGVSIEEYAVYWNHYVVQRFRKYSADDAARLQDTKISLLEVDGAAHLDAIARDVLAALRASPNPVV